MSALGGLSHPLALAVSGGADSTALMHLAAAWAHEEGHPAPVVLTVDHRLQEGSASAAAAVAGQAAALALTAHILTWRGSKPAGDIEAAAREARYRLMGRWCLRHKISALLTAHTLEDQAETFLLRLARGSGLDGLAGMAPRAPYPLPEFPGLALLRPLLGVRREALREDLAARGIAWHEDPMNADPRFARVRLRQAWPAIAAAGLEPARIAAAAAHLSRARTALEAATAGFLAQSAVFGPESADLDTAALRLVPREIGLRALAACVMRVGGSAYRPRFERLERLFNAILSDNLGGGATLAGCRVRPSPKSTFGRHGLCISRETARRSGGRAPSGGTNKSPQ